MIAITLVLLLQQAGPPSQAEMQDHLPFPLLAAEIARPQELVSSLLSSRFKHKLIESRLWQALEDLPQYPMVEIGWQTFLAPVQGRPEDFLAALAGDGLLLMMTAGANPGEFDLSLLSSGHDAELAQDCLAPILGFAGVSQADMAGEEWQLQVGNLYLHRSNDRFALGTSSDALARFSAIPFEKLKQLAIPGECRAAALSRASSNLAWIHGDLLRADGYPDLPEDAGASYFFGDVHEVLRTAPWVGGSLRVSEGEIGFDLFAPVPDGIMETHAPFFPAVGEVPMPLLGKMVMQGIFTRDLGVWWTARHLYMKERAVAESVEGDGTLALLFGRDPGPEIFAWLESDVRLMVSVLPEEARKGLPIEYPSGAIGLRLKEDAPEDLAESFASAFLAAVTFANLDGGGMAEQPMQLDIQKTERGSIYSAGYRAPAEGQVLSTRHNLSPSLLIGDDGQIWISTSLSLLQEIVAAPVQMVEARGIWLDLQVAEMLEILGRDRNILIANRLLEEGGDIKAATDFVDMMMSALAIFNRTSARIHLDDTLIALQVEIQAAP